MSHAAAVIHSTSPGVTCEACHGPGRWHVDAMKVTRRVGGLAPMLNPAKLPAEESVDFCGACHATFWDIALDGVKGIPALRSQPYRLQSSRCWTASAGDARLTCIACHDPHRPLVTDARAYDNRCLGCHVSAGAQPTSERPGPACPVRTSDCATCHMPKYDVPDMHHEFTDHHLRRQSSQQPRSTPRELLAEEMLRFAGVGADDVVYDLGSVETVPIIAAKRFGARAVGIGLDESQLDVARKGAREQGVFGRVSFVEGNLLKAKFSDATVVTLDLSPSLNLILEPILRRELHPGARIVSHRFGIGAWRADDTSRASDGSTVFLWRVPRPPARTPDIFFVPTEQIVVDQMLALAGVTAADTVYDLGSGDGRLVVIAAQKYDARGVGVELDPALVTVSRQVARDAGLADKVKFIEGDLFNVDLSEATVVTLFLSPGTNRRLEEKLKRELKPGARVVSHQFDMGNWAPDRTVAAEDGTSLFLWTIRK